MSMHTPLAARRWQLLAAVALLAALSVSLTAWFIAQDRHGAEREALSEVTLYARVLEDQVTRALNAAANTQRSLAQRGTLRRSPDEPEPAARLLEQQLPGQPFLRSLAVLDGEGRIIASTVDGEAGLRIDLSALGPPSTQTSRDTLGPLLPIRELRDLAGGSAPGTATALPMVRAVPMEDGSPPLWLVALVNPDHFATQHALMTADSSVSATIADLRGGVIASSSADARAGHDLSALDPFRRFLPQHEFGAYIGGGSHGAAVIAGFRTSRQWPLLVLAERPLAGVQAAWRQRAFKAGSVCAAFLALLAGFAWYADRGLRGEQRSREREAQFHRELAETEQRWKLALQGAGHGVWDVDLVTGRASLSPLLIELLGAAPEGSAWNGRQLRQIVHPDDWPAASEAITRHLRGESPQFAHELRVRGADGRWHWLLASATYIESVEGGDRRRRLIGTVTDIGARKNTELALRESEALQQAILRSALDGIVSADSEGRIVGFNPAAERIFGRSAAQVLGQPMHEMIIPHRHRAAHVAGMQRYRATGHGPVLNRRVEVEGMRADGEVFPLELAITPVSTESGEIFTATVRDIGERRRIEQALRESEERFRTAFEQAAVGMLQQDRDGLVVRVNPALCRMLGHGADEIVSQPVRNFLHPEDFEAGGRDIQRLYAGEIDRFAAERRYRHRDGHYVWGRYTASLTHRADGRPGDLLAIVEDVTARREAEAALVQARQRELTIGARIQQSLLLPAPDQRLPGLWLSVLNQASQGIDGDFFDVLPLGPDVVDVIAGDVMGKGVAAAMLGAATKMQFSRSTAQLMARAHDEGGLPQPAEIVADVHRAMTSSLQALEAFVTLTYVRLDARAGTVHWVGCGHEEPLLLHPGGDAVVLGNQHPPLGILDEAHYAQSQAAFAPGDGLFFASDGAADARRPDGSRVGREAVQAIVQRLFADVGTPAAVLHALRRQLQAEGAVFDDDLTLGMAVSSGVTRLASRRELRQGMDDIVHVRELVAARALEAGLDDEQAGLFALAGVEAFTNTVRHTSGAPADAPVELVVRHDGEALVVEITALGEPFEVPQPPAETTFDDYPEGGFGLTIMHAASDHVEYLQRDGVNTVRLTRRLPATGR